MAAKAVAAGAGADAFTADGMIYGFVVREASLLAFTDVFRLSAYVALAILPLILFLKKPSAHQPVALH